METLIGRITLIWILLTVFTMGFVINDISDIQIFKFGPNSGLFIMDICIDTNAKYFSVVIFCFVNSGVRCMNHNILQSWLINTVQNKEVIIVNTQQSYEISLISTIYTWFDFFMYMNILMSQIDMLLVEIIAELIMNTTLTYNYLQLKKIEREKNDNNDNNDNICERTRLLINKPISYMKTDE